MKLRLLIAICVWLIPTTIFAADSYLCIADKATGFHFDKNTKEWEPANFKTESKYILRKIKKNDLTDIPPYEEVTVGDLLVYDFGSSNETGKGKGPKCSGPSQYRWNPIDGGKCVDKDKKDRHGHNDRLLGHCPDKLAGIYHCDMSLYGRFNFNANTMRFLMLHTKGFWDYNPKRKFPDGGNEPNIEIGKCSPLKVERRNFIIRRME